LKLNIISSLFSLELYQPSLATLKTVTPFMRRRFIDFAIGLDPSSTSAPRSHGIFDLSSETWALTVMVYEGNITRNNLE
jgi:hypothetical protein